MSLISGHKYFIIARIKVEPTSGRTTCVIDTSWFQSNYSWAIQCRHDINTNEWVTVAAIKQGVSYAYKFRVIVSYGSVPLMGAGTILKIRNVNIFDLTAMYGAGCEPDTVDKCKSIFSLPYYFYNKL